MAKQDIATRCEGLQKAWRSRNEKFKQWYRLIQMVDELKQEKMESFVGNDPQASFKMLRHMLDQKIPHRIPHEYITVENTKDATDLSNVFETIWRNIDYNHCLKGREGWVWDLSGFLLATGWYSAFAIPTIDGSGVIAEVWNPATVFPVWDDVMVECAHVVKLDKYKVERIVKRSGWEISTGGLRNLLSSGDRVLYDHWKIDTDGNVVNGISLGKDIVKPYTRCPKLSRIPIFTSPVGGLPDTGIISEDVRRAQAELGMSSVATNENIYKYNNKWWTFSMQLLRDTAQARIKEKSQGKQIVKPEDVNKRGAIFRMKPEEDVSFLVPPPIPVEIRATQMDIEAMLQRGGPSWAMFGALPGQVTSYVMSQISASTNQIAKPYHKGIISCISGIDNFLYDMGVKYGYKYYGKTIPKGLPKEARVTAEYELRIPGDLTQRATIARMLDPDFRLSYSRVMEELFPEVRNPLAEKALVRADIAGNHPVNAMLDLVLALREQAEIMRKAKDYQGYQLYMAAAENVQASLGMNQGQGGVQGQSPRPIGTRTEAVPPEGTSTPPTPQV